MKKIQIDNNDVVTYLEAHPGIGSLLAQMLAKAGEEFSNSEINVFLHEGTTLTICVRENNYDDFDIFRCDAVMSRFEKEIATTPGDILVTIDFVPRQ
jgi:hypothetical protein